MYHKIEAFVLSDKCKGFDDLGNWNKEEHEQASMTFLDFYKDMMNKYATTKWVTQNWQSLLTRLEEFGKIIHFEDLTYTNIADFDLHLKKTITSQPVVYKRHQLIKRVILEANKRKITNENPYDFFSFQKGKLADPISLEFDELKKIEDCKPTTKSQQRIKDMYLFQCYTGLAYIDMQDFAKDKLIDAFDFTMIKSARHKTDENYITCFTDEAKEIAERYDYKMPQMSNSNYNQYLKVLAACAGVDKPITTHTARHTFATHMLNKGIDIVVLSKAMGHTNIKQTQRYARLMPKTIADEMSKIFKK